MLPHISKVWYVSTAAEVIGGLSCGMANLRPMSTAVSSSVLQHLACIWIQQIMNMWFSVTISLTCRYLRFPINISCTYGLHTITCNVMPYKTSQDDTKDYWHSTNKPEKCTNIAKHLWLAPSINKLCYDCSVGAAGKTKAEETWT
jgi:hypothetical protein